MTHWRGCCSLLTREDELERLRCHLCGCLITSNAGSKCGNLGSQQSDAGDCANSPGIVTRHSEVPDA